MYLEYLHLHKISEANINWTNFVCLPLYQFDFDFVISLSNLFHPNSEIKLANFSNRGTIIKPLISRLLLTIEAFAILELAYDKNTVSLIWANLYGLYSVSVSSLSFTPPIPVQNDRHRSAAYCMLLIPKSEKKRSPKYCQNLHILSVYCR